MKVKVPKTAAQIELQGYQELMNIEEPDPIQTISCLMGYDTSFIRRWEARSVDTVFKALTDCFKREFNLVRTFTLKGKKYGFIPNLDGASYGEVEDIRNNISDVQDWHKAMAIMYRPIVVEKGERYTIEDYTAEEDSEIMKLAPLDVAIGAQVFFYDLTNDLLKHIPNLTLEEQEILNTHGLGLSGEDITRCVRLVGEIGEKWRKQQSKTFTPV